MARVAPNQDLFQLLPDPLVTAIFCRLSSIKWLLRCEAVCKRWNLLGSLVDKLVFNCEEFRRGQKAGSIGLETFIWRFLSSRMFRVSSLRLLNAPSFGAHVLSSWLKLLSPHLEFFDLGLNSMLCKALLPNKVCFERLVHLSISRCQLDEGPSCFMPCLTSCEFWQLHKFQGWIEKFVQLSPLLKKMKLLKCCYSNLRIASQNLETLVCRGWNSACLEIEAPRLFHLEIQNVNKLVVRAQGLHEFVLWNDVSKAEFCSLPRVSRWVFKTDLRHWTCKEAMHVLESVKDIDIGHVQLATPLICHIGDPLLNPQSKCLHLVGRIDGVMLQSLRAGIYRLVGKDSFGISHVETLDVVVLDNFNEETCDALELLLKECGPRLRFLNMYCGATATGCRFLTRVAKLQRKMKKVSFCWMNNKRDIESGVNMTIWDV